jgi:hypothetical protein
MIAKVGGRTNTPPLIDIQQKSITEHIESLIDELMSLRDKQRIQAVVPLAPPKGVFDRIIVAGIASRKYDRLHSSPVDQKFLEQSCTVSAIGAQMEWSERVSKSFHALIIEMLSMAGVDRRKLREAVIKFMRIHPVPYKQRKK